jgi:hypothetical protein
VTSRLKPIDGPPMISQDLAIPTRKQQTTKIAMFSTSPEFPGSAITSSPWINWMTNTMASTIRNTLSRTVAHRISWRRIRDSSADTMNTSPVAETATDVGPILCPGISANSETASALVNAVKAATARMRCS